MSNMDYCRFQNTVADLEECIEAMNNEEDLSPEEEQAKQKLLKLCARIAEVETVRSHLSITSIPTTKQKVAVLLRSAGRPLSIQEITDLATAAGITSYNTSGLRALMRGILAQNKGLFINVSHGVWDLKERS